jgi:hypothetical protein
LVRYLVFNIISMSAKKAAKMKGRRRIDEKAESRVDHNPDPDPAVTQSSAVPSYSKNSGERSTLGITINPQKATKGGGLGRMIRSFRVGGAGNAFGLGRLQTISVTAPAIPTGGGDTSQASINQLSEHDAVDSSSKPDNLAVKKHPQWLDTVAEKGAGLKVGDMASRVTVSPQQKGHEERQWLATSKEVLTAVKDVPGGITAGAGVGAVIGPLIGVLKLIDVGGFPFLPAIASEF